MKFSNQLNILGKVFIFHLSLLKCLAVMLMLAGCIKSNVDISVRKIKKASVSLPQIAITVSNIQVINHQIVITGTNLTIVTELHIQDGSTTTNLQIESKTATSLVANTLANVTFEAANNFTFVFSSATATSDIAVNFSTCQSMLGGKGFDCGVAPANQDVLSYDATSGKWKPRAVSGLTYQGAWDALNPMPTASVIGDYFIVSHANPPYQVGDWIVYNGSSFNRIDNSQMVTSVLGRNSGVAALEGDYNLNKMADVIITSPATNQILVFNGSDWVNSVETDPTVKAFAKAALPVCGTGEVLKSNGSSLTCVTDDIGTSFNGTANRVLVADGAGALASSSITTSLLGYISSVSSDIQAQINAKLNSSSFVDWSTTGVQTISPARINLVTPNRVIVTNGTGNPSASAVTTTEAGYLSGVTSSIQTQLNSKLSSYTETNPNVLAFAKTSLPTCATGEVLKSNGVSFTCVTDNTGAGSFTGTMNRVVLTNSSTGALTVSTVTDTEVGYLSGITSAIQTQLNNKQAAVTTASLLTAGSVQTNLQSAVEVKPYGAGAGNTSEFRFYELVANGSNYTGFKSPDLLASDIIYTMPDTSPNNGEVLSTTTAGVLSWVALPGAAVTSVNSLNGAVTLTSANVAEGSNLYHTDARVLGSQITAPTLTNSAIATSDTLQVSLGKLQEQINNKTNLITTGTTAQYYRGDNTVQTLDTSAVAENTNLYFTDARARTATVADAIADSVINIAPSQNAVFDALALKLNTSSFIQWNTFGVQTIDPSRLKLSAPNVSKSVVTDGSGFIVTGAASSAEVGYLSGATSSIQTQLNSKMSGTIDSGIRGSTLTGLSLTTNAVLQASDTIINAFGFLQKQITDLAVSGKLSRTGGTLTSGTIGNVPLPTAVDQAANKAYVDSATNTTSPITCPANYVVVPANTAYFPKVFCVAKYEMKDDGYGVAISAASGLPIASITRVNARAKCKAIGAGYDLISNDQWQTIARNIAGTASNWSSGVVASGELNRGHSDSGPNAALAAVTDDNDSCNGTGQSCSPSLWDSQKRTHNLSNGNVIWDFAGNVWEWVTDDNNASNGTDGYASTFTTGDVRQTRLGPLTATVCAAPSATPWCGMGIGYTQYSNGAIFRGGYSGSGTSSGIFASNLFYANTYSDTFLGFRCVFNP